MAIALGIAAGLPPLGQQVGLKERQNRPGETLVPPPRRRPKKKQGSAPADLAALAKAQAKRERRAIRDSRNLAAGCARQTATPKVRP